MCLVKQNDGTWIEKHQCFLFNVCKRFFIFVTFYVFNVFYFFWNVFYIYAAHLPRHSHPVQLSNGECTHGNFSTRGTEWGHVPQDKADSYTLCQPDNRCYHEKQFVANICFILFKNRY